MQQAPHLSDPAQAGQQQGLALKLMELLAVPAFVLDRHGRVLIWNLACERLTGVPAREVLGSGEHWRSFYLRQRPTLADLALQGRGADAAALYDRHARGGGTGHRCAPAGNGFGPADGAGACNRHCSGGACDSLVAENWCDMPRLGQRRYLAADATTVRDAQGAIVAVVQTLRDLTEERQARMALEQLATRDGLTGLANRRCFDTTLQAEWQRALRQQQPLSLLMVDVDNFKQYNDTYGHVRGDDCLQRIATAVASEMRANDLVARYGGEEFAVVLPNQSLKGAAIVAERIRCRVERLRLAGVGMPEGGAGGDGRHGAGSAQWVTVSIGAATALPAPEAEPSQLVATADAALYRAKHMGRNRTSLTREHSVQPT